jgi:hypothetical protein
MNRQENAKLRQSNFKFIPSQFHNEVLELEREYGKYCYLPLAVPVIFDEKIVDWFFNHKKAITKIKADMADDKYGYSLFNSVNVCLDERYQVKNPIWSDNQYTNFKQEFPHFYQQMMDALPLAQIPRFSFWNSTEKIWPHRDHSCLLDMPNSFRVMVYDENPIDTLYLYEETEDGPGKKIYVSKVAGSNSFAWNNLRVEHGSDFNPGYSKILLIINDFIPNYQKYRNVMEQSISTHRDKILLSQKVISDFI